MIRTIGLLSAHGELVDDFGGGIGDMELRVYRSVDAVRGEELSLLAIDVDIFESVDLFQFYLSKIRKKVLDMPVMLVLRVSHLEVVNLDWFFDDFVLYPFRKGELNARLKQLLWEKKLQLDENHISIGNLRINLAEYSVYLNNEKLHFTYKEFEVLRLLIQNPGVVFSRKDLLGRLWGVEYIGGTRTVDVHIRRLRSKLGDEFNTIIETVRNVGYRCRMSAESAKST
ncbi:MAG: response regulator transcription factor [Spirochaetes bacterium]|nr:MAG: response regulator transcription factor [Spirochaetota bacterium]